MNTKTSPLTTALVRRILKYPLFLGLFFAVTLHGALPKIEVDDQGFIAVDDQKFRAAVMNKDGIFHLLNAPSFRLQGKVQRKDGATEMKAILKLPGGSIGTFVQRTQAIPGGLDYKAQIDFSPTAQVNGIVLAPIWMGTDMFGGRTAMVDGKPVEFPLNALPKGKRIFFNQKVQTVEIPLDRGVLVIRGQFSMQLMDQRPELANYSMRIRFTPSSGDVSTSQLNLSMTIRE